MKLYKSNLDFPIVFVSGQIRTGKVFLIKLLSTFKKYEKPYMSALFEQVFTLKHINKITYEVAEYLIVKFLNIIHYNQAIGRDLNLRSEEITSIKNYYNSNRYLNKIKTESSKAYKKTLRERYTIPFMLHNGILEAELILESKKNSKIIEIFKNPFELVYSWKRKNYFGPFFKNARSEILSIEHKNIILPYLFHKKKFFHKIRKKKIYQFLCELILHVEKKKLNSYENLNNRLKKRILLINFKDLLHFKIIKEKLEKFLKVKTNKNTIKVFLKEKNVNRRKTSEIKLEIKNNISPKIFKEMCILEKKINNLGLIK